MKLFKNIKYALGLLAITMLFSACEEYMEETIYSDVTSENFITEDSADQLVVGIYTQVRAVYKNYGFKFFGTDIFTTKSDVTSFNSANDYFGLQATSSNSVWTNNYDVIAKANTAINRFENQISWSEGRLTEKAYGIAQARALRALAFFNLVQQFGGVDLSLEEPLSILENYTRSTEEEKYELIISELEAAIPDLEDNPDTGRFSKRAAQHVLAEVYLTRAYLSFGSTEDFSTAAALAESAIGSYDIRSQTFAEVFDYDNQVNDEVLFATQWGAGADAANKNNDKHSLFMNNVHEYPGVNRTTTPYGFSGYGAMPTPFFYSLFSDNDTRDDATLHRAIIADGDVPTGWPEPIVAGDTIVYYPKETLGIVELTERLERYWVYQPDQYLFGRPDDIPGVNWLYSLNPEEVNFPIFKKFEDEDFNETSEGARDTFVFRVAETHLIAAEAYLGASNTTSALTHINRVRERATGIANEYAAITIDDILNERALELAGESNRWAVLKRTGKLEERLNLYNPHNVDHGAFDPETHYLRPIPTNEITLSPDTMKQNPNY